MLKNLGEQYSMVDQKQSVYVKGQGSLFTDPKSGENIVLRGFALDGKLFHVKIAAKCPFEFPDFKVCDRSDTSDLMLNFRTDQRDLS